MSLKTRKEIIKELKEKEGEFFVKTNEFRWLSKKYSNEEPILQQKLQGNKGSEQWETIETVYK